MVDKWRDQPWRPYNLSYDFTLEGDSLLVFNALSGLSNPPSSVESVIRGIIMVCGNCYKIDFSHVRRLGNRSAHLLAKHPIGIVDFETWMEDSSYFLEQALVHDVSHLVCWLIKV